MEFIDYNSLDDNDKMLINAAIDVRKFAYCPYSQYKVGAALLDANSTIHTGCNVESADYTLTSHAEMVAIDSMVKSGCHEVVKIAIVAKGIGNKPATPCGLCRQKISEFDKSNNSNVIIVNLNKNDEIVNIHTTTLSELLPYSFNSDFI